MNISDIGKRMPYKVPEGAFDEIERNVLSATGCGRKTPHKLRTAGIAFAAAASLAIIATFSWYQQSATMDSMAEVQQAFANLDNADRAFLTEIYNEDTFMNMNY